MNLFGTHIPAGDLYAGLLILGTIAFIASLSGMAAGYGRIVIAAWITVCFAFAVGSFIELVVGAA